MARDGSSGGVVRLVTVDQTGIEKECVLGILIFLVDGCKIYVTSYNYIMMHFIGDKLPYLP